MDTIIYNYEQKETDLFRMFNLLLNNHTHTDQFRYLFKQSHFMKYDIIPANATIFWPKSFKGYVSFNVPCTCRLLVGGLYLLPFS